ncbi:MAG: hypothetical protein QXU32_00800 [Nitrososphaerales archaeon]
MRCISRSGLRLFLTTEEAFPVLEKWYTHDGFASFSKVERIDEIFLDGGGSIFVDEPTVSFCVDDVQFKTYIRHISLFKSILEGCNVDDEIANCVRFGTFRVIYVLPDRTRKSMVNMLGKLWYIKRDEINNLEDKIVSILREAGAIYMGMCSCLSGMPYIRCCGRKQILE